MSSARAEAPPLPSTPTASPLVGIAPARRAKGVAPGRIVVIGGGMSGLVAAYELGRLAPEREVVLLESASRFGGNVRTEHVGGYLLDVGADSFLRTRPEAIELCEELGLRSELVTPRAEGRGVYVARDGALEKMPEGLSLGVPLRLGALLDSPTLTPVGKLRALCEPFVPPRRDGAEESIADFARRRLGVEMAERIAIPLLSGVVAGDGERLSIQAAFPQLAQHERTFGSLLRGMLGGKSLLRALPTLLSEPASSSPFVSLATGMQRLPERLLERIADIAPRCTLRANVSVARIARSDAGFIALTSEGERIECDAVIAALPPWSASKLVPDVDIADELGAIRYSSTATVFFAFDDGDVERTLDASGFIVPEGEGSILAGTWISSKWAGRAPSGHVLLRAFVGGARHPEYLEQDDETLAAQCLGELRRLMGPLGAPRLVRVFRYGQGNPQPELGHLERLKRVRAHLERSPGLILVGAGYGGVGIPDCVRQAREAVRVLLEG